MPYRTSARSAPLALAPAPRCRHALRAAIAVPLGLASVFALAVLGGELAHRVPWRLPSVHGDAPIGLGAGPRRVVPVTAVVWPFACRPEWGCRVEISGSPFAGAGVERRFTRACE